MRDEFLLDIVMDAPFQSLCDKKFLEKVMYATKNQEKLIFPMKGLYITGYNINFEPPCPKVTLKVLPVDNLKLDDMEIKK